LISELIDRNW